MCEENNLNLDTLKPVERGIMEEWLDSMDESIARETADMNRLEAVIEDVRAMKAAAAEMNRLAGVMVAAFKRAEPYFDKHMVGGRDATAAFRRVFVDANAERGQDAERMTIYLDVEDLERMLIPSRRNVVDLMELRGLLKLFLKQDDLIRELEKVDSLRRKPILREIKRVSKNITECCPSILNGHFASPNVPVALTEMVGNFAACAVARSRVYYAKLKKVA